MNRVMYHYVIHLFDPSAHATLLFSPSLFPTWKPRTFVQSLTTLARDQCRKPVTIHKSLIPVGGTINDATPG